MEADGESGVGVESGNDMIKMKRGLASAGEYRDRDHEIGKGIGVGGTGTETTNSQDQGRETEGVGRDPEVEIVGEMIKRVVKTMMIDHEVEVEIGEVGEGAVDLAHPMRGGDTVTRDEYVRNYEVAKAHINILAIETHLKSSQNVKRCSI